MDSITLRKTGDGGSQNERDKLIKKKIQALNNNTISKFSHDKQARIGCKGKNKFYGYKENVCIDMDSGMINKMAVTPANIPDYHASNISLLEKEKFMLTKDTTKKKL